MTEQGPPRTLPWDWYSGVVPENVDLDATAYIETTFSFFHYRSALQTGVRIGRGASTYLGTMFDVGPRGSVTLGDYALLHGAWIICDAEVTIGRHALISWNVVIMDSYRVPLDREARRRELELVPQRTVRRLAADVPALPIHIGDNVWIGFDACVMPGVSIGEGSIIGARSTVFESVPPYCVVAGNPARIIRRLDSSKGVSHD